MPPRGEAGSISASFVAERMVRLRNKMRKFDVESIFNVDETVLLFKVLQRRAYLYGT